ncbi:winged helix-turn-helix domain-containing protein [Yersinia enterocolitica]|uniref:winged helix-turn-helix domain-containing protein n=1 Tax=Yersinia enterocolitica TaxID=630 RepID=UPI000A47F3FB|nr:winged helix-turn-helix domain-containing protein [Yersinia enterocolitica]
MMGCKSEADLRGNSKLKDYIIGKNVIFNNLKCNISSADKEVILGSREASLMELFCNNPNEVITKGQIHDAVWGKLIVNETSLTKAVSNLRKLLSTFDSLNCEIKTVPKEGYLFIFTEGPDNWSFKENLLGGVYRETASDQSGKLDTIPDGLDDKLTLSFWVRNCTTNLTLVYVSIFSSLLSSVITIGILSLLKIGTYFERII